jgi:AcrR family transcriptional regulator
MPPADTREILLRAALPLFVAQGVDGTGIRDIARRAGLTNPALYRHFPGKEQLAAALFERCYTVLAQRLEQAMATPGGFPARLRAVVGAFLAMVDEDPHGMTFVAEQLTRFWPGLPPSLKQRSIAGLLRRLIRQGAAEGQAPPEVSPEVLLAMLLGLVSQLARMACQGQASAPAQLWAGDIQALMAQIFGITQQPR